MAGAEAGGRDDGRVAGFQSDGSGVDDEIGEEAVGGEFGVVEAEGEDFGGGAEGGEAIDERGEFFGRSVDEDEARDALESALCGDGLTGTAACA